MNSTLHYHQMITQLRSFFVDRKKFIEVPTQSRLSILAACEDPKTIATFFLGDNYYPLPQTGQMWLEHELLQNPGSPGFFCITTSYRNEPNIIPGRHFLLFPLVEFEATGGVEELKKLETELLTFLGFQVPISVDYDAICKRYNKDEIDADIELSLWHDVSSSISLEQFPPRSYPFWNMRKNKNGLYNKIDMILYGMETIGSAERSIDKNQMYEDFFSVSNGGYAQLLFEKFGKQRVMQELEYYLSFSFFERFGGGIGLTRLERAMKLAGLFDVSTVQSTYHRTYSDYKEHTI